MAATTPLVTFRRLLRLAVDRRAVLAARGEVSAYRVFGDGDGADGLYIDRYGPGAVLALHDTPATTALGRDLASLGTLVLDELASSGVTSVYGKHFARDRSRLPGDAPAHARDRVPLAGVPLPEALVVHEYASAFEVRLYDGLSTGLFIDQRENRRALAALGARRVLNLFAYTCAFAVPLVRAGAHVVNVDVSARYLDWGRRNLALNGLPADGARFVRMDARAYLAYAARRAMRFDLVILDPPTFGSASKRRDVPAWSAARDYPALVSAAAAVLEPRGALFAAANAQELCRAGRFRAAIVRGLSHEPRWADLPPPAVDVAIPPELPPRMVAELFTPKRRPGGRGVPPRP